MLRTPLAILVLALALAPFPARPEIFRCTSAGGAVTYQQDPCDAHANARVIDVPDAYPAANSAERERLFAREAALDRRLEAARERWSREAIAQAMQPAPAPEASAPPEVVWIAPPFAFPRHPFPHRRAMHGFRRY
jgi:hypothetical protein